MEFNVFDTILWMAYMFLMLILSVMVIGGMFFGRMPKILGKMIGTCGALIACISLHAGYTMVKADYDMYQTEAKCVERYIANNIPRRDIGTAGGRCYLQNRG